MFWQRCVPVILELLTGWRHWMRRASDESSQPWPSLMVRSSLGLVAPSLWILGWVGLDPSDPLRFSRGRLRGLGRCGWWLYWQR